MRHSKASTTFDIYMQVGDNSQREALAKLESIVALIWGTDGCRAGLLGPIGTKSRV